MVIPVRVPRRLRNDNRWGILQRTRLRPASRVANVPPRDPNQLSVYPDIMRSGDQRNLRGPGRNSGNQGGLDLEERKSVFRRIWDRPAVGDGRRQAGIFMAVALNTELNGLNFAYEVSDLFVSGSAFYTRLLFGQPSDGTPHGDAVAEARLGALGRIFAGYDGRTVGERELLKVGRGYYNKVMVNYRAADARVRILDAPLDRERQDEAIDSFIRYRQQRGRSTVELEAAARRAAARGNMPGDDPFGNTTPGDPGDPRVTRPNNGRYGNNADPRGGNAGRYGGGGPFGRGAAVPPVAPPRGRGGRGGPGLDF